MSQSLTAEKSSTPMSMIRRRAHSIRPIPLLVVILILSERVLYRWSEAFNTKTTPTLKSSETGVYLLAGSGKEDQTRQGLFRLRLTDTVISAEHQEKGFLFTKAQPLRLEIPEHHEKRENFSKAQENGTRKTKAREHTSERNQPALQETERNIDYPGA